MQRRSLLRAGAASAVGLLSASRSLPAPAAGKSANTSSPPANTRAAVIAQDGTTLFVRQCGTGDPVLFVAAWGLDSLAWQYQMERMSREGFRCVAFDRRSHGRSSDPGAGYDLETLAHDVHSVIEQLRLSQVLLVGHSLGAAESVRYLTRHGMNRVRRLALVAPTTPFLLKSGDNPDGLDPKVLEGMRAAFREDFPGILAANIRPFVLPTTSQAMIDWIVDMMSRTPVKALIDCNAAFSAADFRAELPAITLPTLILQGDADMSAPLALTGRKTAALLPNALFKVYQGAPHGLVFTHADRVASDLVAFARG